jgi:hypothetical protein
MRVRTSRIEINTTNEQLRAIIPAETEEIFKICYWNEVSEVLPRAYSFSLIWSWKLLAPNWIRRQQQVQNCRLVEDTLEKLICLFKCPEHINFLSFSTFIERVENYFVKNPI